MLDFVATSAAVHIMGSPVRGTSPVPPPLDVVQLAGFMSAFFTLVVWPYRRESKTNQIAFAAGLLLLSVYTFLAGAWPMGIVATVWTGVTVWEASGRIRIRRSASGLRPRIVFSAEHWSEESRMSRMFGPNRG